MESLTSPGEPRIGLAEVPLVLWDFVKSDFSTFVLPSTAFGFLGALAAPKLTEFPQSPSIGALLIRAVPRTLLFNTGNLLVFDIANQRLPESVDEDSVNKPWRSLPRGRINPTQARRLLLGTVPAVLAGSAMLGVGAESGLILLLTWMYNDLGGGDELTRDPIIAVAYVAFLVSSLHIAMLSTVGHTASLSITGYQWLGMIGGLILTTMHIQDLRDQVGDRARGRKTWPLVMGEGVSRCWLAISVSIWSIASVLFWKTPILVSVIPLYFGVWIGWIVWFKIGDVLAWRMWCLWQALLYALPILLVFGC